MPEAGRRQGGASGSGQRVAVAALCLMFSLFSTPAFAETSGIEIHSAAIHEEEGAYLLDADFQLQLAPAVEDLLARGITLHFALEFELIRKRSYWFDRTAAARSQDIRLSYYPITRSYRLSTGPLQQSFATLDSALRTLSRIRRWPVAQDGEVQVRKTYEAALRLELDRTQLPKPMQLTELGGDTWTLSSGWHRWTYSPETGQ